MGKVELAVLRLGAYELRYDDDIPNGVAINEAIEIAKKYGQESSGGFVNAILAKIMKSGEQDTERNQRTTTEYLYQKYVHAGLLFTDGICKG